LTVVSYGTSAPELAVSMAAAASGQSAIVLGNVIGSNVANIGLILGLTALIAPPRVDGLLFKRELPFLLAATLALGPVLLDSTITRVEGLVLLAGAIGFSWATFRWAKHRSPSDHDEDLDLPSKAVEHKTSVLWALLLVGAAVLVAGGHVFVTGAVGLAKVFGVSERVIGLTIVAFGTSLPELAASVMAAYRGHSDLAVGNVVGSNLFNTLLILGATASVLPITGSLAELGEDLVWMTALTLLMAASMSRARRITRVEGVILSLAYVAFIARLVL
jgi:cation:H+ antiporter